MHRRDVVALNKALAAYKKLSPKARAAKDFPLVHALLALATFVAVGGKVLAETPDTKLDFARQFDIGAGRKLFLECRGVARAGYPTVVLIDGYHGSSNSWMLSHCCRSLSARQYCQDWRARTGSVPMTGQEPCGTWQIRR